MLSIKNLVYLYMHEIWSKITIFLKFFSGLVLIKILWRKEISKAQEILSAIWTNASEPFSHPLRFKTNQNQRCKLFLPAFPILKTCYWKLPLTLNDIFVQNLTGFA